MRRSSGLPVDSAGSRTAPIREQKSWSGLIDERISVAGEGEAKQRMKGAGNPSPVWEKGRDEGLPPFA
ncbi:hypothetical protein BHK69_11770 [Bosea vaviloviae]|uniref:Uncharacterized protein n=1 Tax=Bosea vaviloviae TaxID=1526658 RepID=A0A1D7U124_9HYPH|nr:hypothetical protein BHK69_11770 [Bosea vaviloviae]